MAQYGTKMAEDGSQDDSGLRRDEARWRPNAARRSTVARERERHRERERERDRDREREWSATELVWWGAWQE